MIGRTDKATLKEKSALLQLGDKIRNEEALAQMLNH